MLEKYKTIDELISLLRDKGFEIDNENKTKEILQNVGYYKLINGYKEPFKSCNGKLCKDVKFENVFSLYCFDREIRLLFLKYISIIEIMIKSRMSNVISNKYGINQNQYLKAENFKPDTNNKNEKKFEEIKVFIQKSISQQMIKNNSIKWYSEKYNNEFPFWVIINILTLGQTSSIYSKMKEADKNLISKDFNLKPDFLNTALIFLTLFRNVCAHNEVLYRYKVNKKFSIKNLNKIYQTFNIPLNEKNEFVYGVSDLFSLIIIMFLLLNKDDFNDLINQLQSCINKLKDEINNEKIFNKIMKNMGIVNKLECFECV